jgi:lysozyme family protein
MAEFRQAVQLVIQREGGLVMDPADPGGATKYGISKKAYPLLDIVGLTTSQAAEIYHRDYWRWDGLADQLLANKLLDMAVNFGLPTLAGMVQKMNGLPADNIWGPATENSLLNAPDVLPRLRMACVERYLALIETNPQLSKFRAGWLLRACS